MRAQKVAPAVATEFYKSQTTGRNLLTDFKEAGLDINSRAHLEMLIVELLGLLEERNKLDSTDKSTRSKASRALWMDRLAEVDTRF
mmetsp:Transcript_26535/g.35495  ORF Transcript_26535/g.35495 Transcript_26535/m.35495 type:complete len:86 (-) Transcript_26535:358-615(-)|eukprot:CAMPEP_0185584248 /NCGR_PEP_ID=MMETSP0434-20130131/31041_1 /TAXON_ID=626734 ORGANISM="Favella taraikaensis, Strain Fe Narragansett Bay" /NCGR_SAMPLE_ID=MMETSP0434 /ASSEMBLY_ACC=CAM_ASM_000379 /LENGTH=85 /DNA_ID=CAMNT_0028203879 /DNA_START=62 /DNA_END=319 /DNA_ORIENTATION=+